MKDQENKQRYLLRKQNIPFTQVPNGLIRNPKISGCAKALWCYFQSRPDGWSFNMPEIITNFSEGRDKIYKSMKELIDNGYMEKIQNRDENGHFTQPEYFLYHEPLTLDNKESTPLTEKPYTASPYTANPTLSIKKKEIKKENLSRKNQNGFPKPTPSEILEECLRENYSIDVDRFFKYLTKQVKLNSPWQSILMSWAVNPKNTVAPNHPFSCLYKSDVGSPAWIEKEKNNLIHSLKYSHIFQNEDIYVPKGAIPLDKFDFSKLKFESGEWFYEIDDSFPIKFYEDLFSSLKINFKKI